ncbi:hypothetical protein J5N97_009793 [Dioscorea zingiberensis]|uniref:Ubiquitin-like protease family profile domain-containing protein n=1 Tax=Dioscorea zingiberensis TaxID=325984 RepID=A0A9D5CY73_9LILI|nr:hypothetical protein J5N97_009793 [Dioscorea zingiberensis]
MYRGLHLDTPDILPRTPGGGDYPSATSRLPAALSFTLGQEESSLRTNFNALKMEFKKLESHVLAALTDIRWDKASMAYGQPAAKPDATMDDVKEELASIKKKMDEMQGKLDDYIARDEYATKTGAGTAMDHQENEERDVSQDHTDVATGHSPTGPDREIGVTQELHSVRIPRATRSKKEPTQGKAAEVIDVATGALTREAMATYGNRRRWYFPSRFSIFAPVNDGNYHWYLVAMDVTTQTAWLVDSLQNVDTTLREAMA